MADNEKRKQALECHGRNHAEIDRREAGCGSLVAPTDRPRTARPRSPPPRRAPSTVQQVPSGGTLPRCFPALKKLVVATAIPSQLYRGRSDECLCVFDV